jgi:hypothetical protein
VPGSMFSAMQAALLEAKETLIDERCPPLQLPYEFLAQRITTVVERPILRARDVFQLRFVQLAAIGAARALVRTDSPMRGLARADRI